MLAGHCRDQGTDFDSITRSSNFNVILGDTESEVADKLAGLVDLYRKYLPDDEIESARGGSSIFAYRNSPTVGTPEQVVEALRELRDAGMTYAICYFPQAAHDPSSVQLFADKVIPELT